jgi:hypothetical protein
MPDSQAGRLDKVGSANLLSILSKTTDNQQLVADVSQNKPCPNRGTSDNFWLNPMTLRSITYWLACTIAAAIAAGAAESDATAALPFSPTSELASSVIPVPEPSRALFLFAGIMAMAFTYRRAWMNWKRGC